MTIPCPQYGGHREECIKNRGGETGIRTPGTRKGTDAFEAPAFNHSAISPQDIFLYEWTRQTFISHDTVTGAGKRKIPRQKTGVCGRRMTGIFQILNINLLFVEGTKKVVGNTGIEPVTSGM